MARGPIFHPKLMQTISRGSGGRQLSQAVIIEPAGVVKTADGGTTRAGTATEHRVSAWRSGDSYQAIRARFGDQLAVQITRVLIVPAYTTIEEGWRVELDRETFYVLKVSAPLSREAPFAVALGRNRPLGS